MNQHQNPSDPAVAIAAEAQFARRITGVLERGAESLDLDVAARLRFARGRALERAREVRVQAEARRLGTTQRGAAILGSGSGWWIKLASMAPVLALVCGLLLIQQAQNRTQISVAAEVDAALLADDLPPAAYTDPVFGEFLKLPSPR